MAKIKRAIISVTDKTGVPEFAKELAAMGVEIISTGGTARALEEAGVDVIPISDVTGFPEMLDGRVKTLHPKIHGGLLGIRDNKAHAEAMRENGIEAIDMVVVNLYAFEDTVKGGATLAEAIENIDIGGPSMLRSAAKNHAFVAAVTDPGDYGCILEEMKSSGGEVSDCTRLALAKKVFALTARYDGAISNYLSSLPDEKSGDSEKAWCFPSTYTFQFEKVQDLRYGENPHQPAAFYKNPAIDPGISTLANAEKLHGKELSYNNILDLSACSGLVKEFTDPAAILIKHNNPCGVAVSKKDLVEAYEKALACDSTSAFGGIFGFNTEITEELAVMLKPVFFEAIIAPSFNPAALDILKGKKNLRILKMAALDYREEQPEVRCRAELRTVSGGFLIQEADTGSISELKTATDRDPTEEELEDLLFAWRVGKHVKSNVIVLAKDGSTVGIGAGQMSRIDSTKISVMKAESAGLEVKGSVLASDAFFPFSDNVELAAENGVTAIIQPGGSIRDDEVIAAANKHGIAMVFTGIRHFRH